MPISSGANSWPASYWNKPSPKPPNTKLVVVDRGRSPSPSPIQIRRPSPPPSPMHPPPADPEVVYIERHSPPPPPQRIYIDRPAPPPPPDQHITYISQHHTSPRPPSPHHPPPSPTLNVTTYSKHYPPPSTVTTYSKQYPPPSNVTTYSKHYPPPSNVTTYSKQYPPPSGHPPNRTHIVNHGYSGYREYGYSQYPDGRYPNGEGGYYGDSTCCADSYFSTNTAGANAGCCQGGMFGSRSYPYSPEQYYMLKGTGRRRCCACVCGLLLGLLLLGLLIGLLAGLLPALQKQAAQDAIVKKFANGYWLNGVYYYKITNPPDIFYWAMGFGIPCNVYNNNTIVNPTVSYANESVINETIITHIVTQAPQVTLPNCNSIVTSFIPAVGFSITTTTVNPFLLLTSSAAALYAKAFATLLAAVVVRFFVG